MDCGNYREEITCEIIGIRALVYVNQDFTDELPFHLIISG